MNYPEMLWPRRAVVISLCVLLSGFAHARAQKKEAGASLQPDKGKFSLLVDGKPVGHEEFEIAPSGAGWLARGTTMVQTEKGETKVTGNLTLQPDGAPISYDWTAQTDKSSGAHIIFANGIAKITLEMQGAKPYEQSLTFGTPLIAILDNNLYHQYALLARLYDWSKGGAQQFPVLIPQELTPGTITVESTGSASAQGKTYEVPSAKVSVVRE